VIYFEKPVDFKEDNESAGIILQAENKIAVLKRNEDEIFAPGKWGFPGGKMKKKEPDPDDSIKQTASRELFEETGILRTINDFHLISVLFIELPHISFIYHLFTMHLKQKIPIQVNLD